MDSLKELEISLRANTSNTKEENTKISDNKLSYEHAKNSAKKYAKPKKAFRRNRKTNSYPRN
jgi:hypothetical protein